MSNKPPRFSALPLAVCRAAIRRPWAMVLLVVLLLGLSAFALVKTPLASDVTRLIPESAKRTSLYFHLMEDFGTMEKLFVIFSADDVSAHLDAIDRAGEELERLDSIETVRWKITPQMREFIRDKFLPKLPLYLSEGEMDEFIARLRPEEMEAALKKTQQRLLLPGGSKALMDPLGLWESFSDRMRFADVDVDLSSGYYITPEGRRLIMMATPTGSPRDITFDRELIDDVNTVLERTLGPGLTAELTGSHAITLHEASIVKGEIVKNFLTALVAVLLIFAVFLRGLRGMAASILPVVLSIGATTGLASFAAGAITEISGGFAGLLIGLGADLGIVLYVRYALLMRDNRPPGEAMEQSVRSAGAGITVGVLTTAATFLPMLLSSFRGIRELGLLTGMGIMITLVFLFGLFPLLVSKKATRLPAGAFGGEGRAGAVAAVFGFSYRRPRLTLALALVITLALAAFIPRVTVEDDITQLGSRKNPARDALQSLERDYVPQKPLIITGIAETPEDAAALVARVEEKLSPEARAASFSFADLLPPLAQQQRNLARLAALDADKIINDLKQTARSLEMRTGAFEGYIEGLRRTLANTEPVRFRDLAPLTEFVERVLRQEDGGGWRFIISAPDPGTEPEGIKGVQFTGARIIRTELLSLLARDAALVTVVGLLLVNLILFASFRKVSAVLLCQAPVVLASAWLLGLMGALGISFNFMNAIVFVMLFGIGTDYTIHLLHRRAQGGDIEDMARDTGTAVVLAGLTTFAGFGSMWLSAYRGMASLGAATALGVMACVIVSITLIPALFGLQEKRHAGKD